MNSSDRICMASVLGSYSTIVTSYAFKNEPQLCTKFTCSTLWLSCISHHGNKGRRKHFQLKSSNGHPLNAVSSDDGVSSISLYIILYISLYDFLSFFFLLYVVVDIVKVKFILIKMIVLCAYLVTWCGNGCSPIALDLLFSMHWLCGECDLSFYYYIYAFNSQLVWDYGFKLRFWSCCNCSCDVVIEISTTFMLWVKGDHELVILGLISDSSHIKRINIGGDLGFGCLIVPKKMLWQFGCNLLVELELVAS